MNKITVMLVDDHVIVRTGFRMILECTGNFEILAEANSGEQAYDFFTKLEPEITLMDISMPGMGGIESLVRIRNRFPRAKIIVLSMHEHTSFVTQSIKAGANGYLTKSNSSEELVDAIRTVWKGNFFLSSSIAQSYAIDSFTNANDVFDELNAREFEVFRLLATGMALDEIATSLKLSSKTVANYQSQLKKKLNVNNPIEIVKLAMQKGLIESN